MAWPRSAKRRTGRSDRSLAAAVNSSPDAPDQLREMLADARSLLERFEQFLAESTQIIPAVGDALIRGELDAIGPLVDRSQQLAESMLHNQVEQTIFLQRSARQLGATAASAFGAGFGGSVWALVPESVAQEFERRWTSEYHRQFAKNQSASKFFRTRAGPGVVRLLV